MKCFLDILTWIKILIPHIFFNFPYLTFFKVDSKKENDEILQFLNESNFVKDGTADHIWLGMNSGKRAGNYVIDNSRPQKTIDWFNWDQNSGSNESGSKNSIQMNTTTGTWFRTTRNGSAAAICSKPILTK